MSEAGSKKSGAELIIGFGKPKPGAEPGEGTDAEEAKDESDIDAQLGAAFDAAHDDDKEGFTAAMRAALKAMCAEYMTGEE